MPVSDAPIADGALLIGSDGKIIAAGPDAEVPRPENTPQHHLADAALLPGLINTHTHLELTGMTGAADPTDFAAWLRQVMVLRDARSETLLFDAAVTGVRQAWAAGVTMVADTGSAGVVIQALDHLGAAGIAFHEAFGPDPARIDEVLPPFRRAVDRLAHHASGRVTLGLSPHAPYSVSGPLYQSVVAMARAHGAPVAFHLAESAAESALLADFTGPFAELFRSRGIPQPVPQPRTPVQWLAELGVLDARTLAIHLIQVNAADIALLREAGVAVAHCPRANERHHGATAPVPAMLAAGLRVGLGTDSELSVAPTDLLAEARRARALAEWDAATTLRALTLGAAEALGCAQQVGALTPGRMADLVAIRVAGDDPIEAILASGPDQVVGTWLGGRRVWG